MLLSLPLHAHSGLGVAADGPVWRFAPEQDYAPFIYQDPQGRLRGLSVEVLDRVVHHTGLRLQVLPARPLNDILVAARNGQADLITSLRPTPERSTYLDFTRPYVRVPAVLVTRQPSDPRQLTELVRQPVGVGEGYAVQAHGRREHPGIDWRGYPNDAAALGALVRGEVQAVVADVASVVHLRQRHPAWAVLAIRGPVGFEYPLSLAYPKGQTALGQALEHGLRAITPAEQADIQRRWLDPEVRQGAHSHHPLITRVGLMLLLVGAGLVLGQALWRHPGRRRAH